jgi:hypothetical protein
MKHTSDGIAFRRSCPSRLARERALVDVESPSYSLARIHRVGMHILYVYEGRCYSRHAVWEKRGTSYILHTMLNVNPNSIPAEILFEPLLKGSRRVSEVPYYHLPSPRRCETSMESPSLSGQAELARAQQRAKVSSPFMLLPPE